MHAGFTRYSERLGEFIRGAESLSAVDADTAFESLALDLFRLQFSAVEPYRRFCEARGLTASRVAGWRDIPHVPAVAFKEFALTSLAPGDRSRVFCSSGTTGQRPSRHFHNAASLLGYERALWPPFRRHLLAGLSARPELICLTPSPALAPHSSLVHMFDAIRRALDAPASAFVGRTTPGGAWDLEPGLIGQRFGEAGSRGEAVLVLGTAFSFVQLLDLNPGIRRAGPTLHRRPGFTLPNGSRVMETGGYKGRTRELTKAELHRRLSQRLGIPETRIVSEYGMSELTSQAYDHVAGEPIAPGGRRFQFPPWARATLVSPETGRPVADGETGLIRVLDLANVSSVLAIQTEDMGVCRRAGFELLGRAPSAEPRGCSRLAL